MLNLNGFCSPLSKGADDLLDKINKQYKDNGRNPGLAWTSDEGEEDLYRELVDKGILKRFTITSLSYKLTDDYLRYGMP